MSPIGYQVNLVAFTSLLQVTNSLHSHAVISLWLIIALLPFILQGVKVIATKRTFGRQGAKF